MFSEDVLGNIMSFGIHSSYDLNRFAAVSWSWITAIAASEDVIDRTLAYSREVGVIGDSSAELLWAVDLNRADPQYYSTLLLNPLRVTRFLEKEVLKARLQLVDDYPLIFDDWGLEAIPKRSAAIRELFEEQSGTSNELRGPQTVVFGVRYDNDVDIQSVSDVLPAVRNVAALTLGSYSFTSTSVEAALRNCAGTLTTLSIHEKFAASPVLLELPLLQKLAVTSVRDWNADYSAPQKLPMKEVLINVGKLVQLTSLNINGGRHSSPLDSHWSSHLSGLTKLTSFGTESDHVCVQGTVFDGMSCGDTLTELNLSWCQVTSDTVLSAIRCFPKLKSLHACYGSSEGVNEILGSLRDLEVFDVWQASFLLSSLKHATGCTNLHSMVISSADAPDPDTDKGETWDAIQKLAPLRAIDASDIDCRSDSSFNAMVDAFASHTSLRFLSLSDPCKKQLTTTSLGVLPDIEVLDVRGCSVALPALRSIAQLRSLRCLNVSGSELDDEGCALMAALPQLHDLNVGKCIALTAASLATLGSMKRLQTLELPQMGPAFWPSAEILPDGGDPSLDSKQKLFPVLKCLRAKDNSLLTGQQLIAGVLRHVPFLQEIELCDCKALTLEDITSIICCCRHLVEVKLGSYMGTLKLPLVATTKLLVEELPSVQKMNVRELEGDEESSVSDAAVKELVELIDAATHLKVFTANKNVRNALRPLVQRVTITEW